MGQDDPTFKTQGSLRKQVISGKAVVRGSRIESFSRRPALCLVTVRPGSWVSPVGSRFTDASVTVQESSDKKQGPGAGDAAGLSPALILFQSCVTCDKCLGFFVLQIE